jgi:diguanylate cyclase (GGDEF)-like protein
MKTLVADDDAVTRRTLVGLLEQLGHTPIEARDGLEAWNAIHAEDAPPLLVLDWMMPGLSGVEICRRLRSSQKRPYHYILILTARDSKDDLIEGLEAGADEYLSKPADLRELRARVRAAERVLLVQDELRARAITDELTGVLNRRGIVERIGHEFALVLRDDRPLSVVLLDVDHFKAVNDTFGHHIGDEVLVEIARRLRSQLRPYDDVGRYGGEEFAITLPACRAEDAVRVACRVRRAICETPIASSSGPISATVSAGVASAAPRRHAKAEHIIAEADTALYTAKGNGRNRVELYRSRDEEPA